MAFAHDTDVALVSAAALVNTAGSGGDTLTGRAELETFLSTHPFTGSRTHRAAELAGVRALRPRLRALWESDRDHVVELVNTLLREARALPQLVRHDDWDWHLHATREEAPLATRMAVEAAMAVADLVRADELDRLRLCAAEDCSDVVVDLSRNRSKRFCDRGCGNRLNAAAYRRRQR